MRAFFVWGGACGTKMRLYHMAEMDDPMAASAPTRKPINLPLDPALLQEARALGIDLSLAAEVGLRRAIAAARSAEWRRENAAALASSNTWVEQNGLPLARYRAF